MIILNWVMHTGVSEEPKGSALREEQNITGTQKSLIMPGQTVVAEMWRQPLNPAREEKFWDEMAELNGMRVVDMAHDGSCLYWCVVCWRRIQNGLCTQGQTRKFEGTEQEMSEVRESVAVAIENDENFDANFIVTEESFGKESTEKPKNKGASEEGESTMDWQADGIRLKEENVNAHHHT